MQIECEMFHIMAQPKTNCVFRTFRVKESFWAKKQSCITLKVGIKKKHLFLVFVCFSGRQFFSLSLQKRLNVFKNWYEVFYEYIHTSSGFGETKGEIWKLQKSPFLVSKLKSFNFDLSFLQNNLRYIRIQYLIWKP